jgi:tyrosine decarboxylase / aspartate 1-decarboxylase
VAWVPRATDAAAAGALARRIFAEAARRDLHLALAQLPTAFFAARAPELARDGGTVTCLRSVLMKPEHLAWLDRIWARLDAATTAALGDPAGG